MPAEERHGCGQLVIGGQMLRARAIRFQGFERRGRCFFERSAVLLDGCERFTNLGSELDRDLTQSIHHVFDLRGLRRS